MSNQLKAFEYIYKKHFNKLVSKYKEDEDLVNEAFCKWIEIYNKGKITKSDTPGAIYNYIKRAIRDLRYNKYKRFDPFLRSTNSISFEQIDDRTPEYLLLKKEENIKVNNIVNTLTPVRQTQIKALMMTGSLREAATETKVSYNTIKVNIHYAKNQIKQAFSDTPMNVIDNNRILLDYATDGESDVISKLGSASSMATTNSADRRNTRNRINKSKRGKPRASSTISLETEKQIAEQIKLGKSYQKLAKEFRVNCQYIKKIHIKYKLE